LLQRVILDEVIEHLPGLIWFPGSPEARRRANATPETHLSLAGLLIIIGQNTFQVSGGQEMSAGS
jgi:hypothetical protein